MKKLLASMVLLTAVSVASLAQSTKDSTQVNKEEVKQKVGNAVEKADEKVQQEFRKSARYQQQNGLKWFEEGTVFAGGSLGFGLGANSGTYLTLNPRVGYFFNPGFMAGIRYGFDNRLSTSFRSREFSLYTRYYPFRTRINGFGGVGYNFGREFASNIGADEKAHYNSITLEAGVGFWLMKNLGGEVSLETNYYDRSNALAGRNRGGRIKFGVNYYFNRKVNLNKPRRNR